MEFADRLLWWLVGCAVGFIAGYIVRSLQEIKEELDEVDEIVKKDRGHGESGFVRYPYVADVMLVAVIAIVVWASFATARVNSELNQTVACLTDHNTRLTESLTARDREFQTGADSEIELWSLYEDLYKIAKSDPKKIPVLQDRLNKAIIKHRDGLVDLQETRSVNPYPNPNFIENCEDK